jgi:hypothetical protein
VILFLLIGFCSYKAYADDKCDKCSSQFTAGEVITLTATPNEGNVFVRWEGDFCHNSTNPVCTFTMPEKDVNIKAVFKPKPPKPRNIRIEDF